MSASPDIDQLVRAFLHEGPTTAPERAVDAALDSVHRVRRLPRPRTRRDFFMARSNLTAGAIVVVLAIALGAWILRPLGGTGVDTSPSPTAPAASTTPAPSEAVPTATAVIVGPDGPLEVGQTYRVPGFTVPFSFTTPDFPPAPPSVLPPRIVGDPHVRGIYRIWEDGVGALTISYDTPQAVDLCHPDQGTVPGVPSTPEAIGAWLAADPALKVSKPTPITVDGRRSLYWDVTFGSSCYAGPGPAAGGPAMTIRAGEWHRFYAIWTGVRTLLATEWAADDVLADTDADPQRAAMTAAADQLVKSLTFP